MTYSCITFSDLSNDTNIIAQDFNYFSCHCPFKGTVTREIIDDTIWAPIKLYRDTIWAPMKLYCDTIWCQLNCIAIQFGRQRNCIVY